MGGCRAWGRSVEGVQGEGRGSGQKHVRRILGPELPGQVPSSMGRIAAITQMLLAALGLGLFAVYLVGLPSNNAPSLTIVHWNMTVVDPTHWGEYVDSLHKATAGQPAADVVIITNPTWGHDLEKLSSSLGPTYRTVRVGVFALATRLP